MRKKKTLKAEIPAKSFDFPMEEVPFPTQEISTSELQTPKAEIIAETPIKSEPEFEPIAFEPPTETAKPTPEPQQTMSAIANLQSEEFLNSIPIKLPPITAEELEHIEDKILDEQFERKLLRLGDNLFPIKNASALVETALHTIAVKAEVSNANSGAAVAPALDYSHIIPSPEAETGEMPVLSDNPTKEEMIAYAKNHPLYKKINRLFGVEIIEISKVEK